MVPEHWPDRPSVAILGGTGAMGKGLARRFAAAGLPVVIGSRDAGRARSAAEQLAAVTGADVRGATNAQAARLGDVAVVTVPWEGHAALLTAVRRELAGRVVVDCVNPLSRDDDGVYAVPVAEGSAAQQAAALLPESFVTGAFHHVAAAALSDPAALRVDCDVLVVGDDAEASLRTVALVERIPGLRGVHAGGLRQAGGVEAMAASLIEVSRRRSVRTGVRITGL